MEKKREGVCSSPVRSKHPRFPPPTDHLKVRTLIAVKRYGGQGNDCSLGRSVGRSATVIDLEPGGRSLGTGGGGDIGPEATRVRCAV